MTEITPNPSTNPLYLEMICNQFPEAQLVLERLTTMCRYKVHDGWSLSAEDYDIIMQTPFAEALQRITSQAANLFKLNKAIHDLSDEKTRVNAIAEELNIDINEEGNIDIAAFEQRMHEALALHDQVHKTFQKTIQDINQWIDDNLDNYLAYEESLAQSIIKQLQQPLTDQEARETIEKRHPKAPNKNELIQKHKQKHETWRKKVIQLFSLPMQERRIALAQIMAKPNQKQAKA